MLVLPNNMRASHAALLWRDAEATSWIVRVPMGDPAWDMPALKIGGYTYANVRHATEGAYALSVGPEGSSVIVSLLEGEPGGFPVSRSRVRTAQFTISDHELTVYSTEQVIAQGPRFHQHRGTRGKRDQLFDSYVELELEDAIPSTSGTRIHWVSADECVLYGAIAEAIAIRRIRTLRRESSTNSLLSTGAEPSSKEACDETGDSREVEATGPAARRKLAAARRESLVDRPALRRVEAAHPGEVVVP